MVAERAASTMFAPVIDDSVGLPVLAPRAFAPADVVDPQLRAARAELARLHLELRGALRVADQARAAPPKADVGPVAELLAANLRQNTERRQREFDEEVAGARAEAASLVDAARTEADREVSTARDEALHALLGAPTVAPTPPPAPPALRIVEDHVAAAPPALVPEPEPEPISVVGADEPPRVTPTVSAPLAGSTWAPPMLDPSSTLAQQLAAAGVTTTGVVPIIVLPGAGAPPGVPAGFPTPYPPPSEPSALPHAPAASDARPLWRRFLYLDVILPAVAVLIVLVVLVAWMG